MLQSLRNSTRHPITKILLGLVLIAFAFLGLGSFLPSMQMKSNFISAGKTEVSINQIAKPRWLAAPKLAISTPANSASSSMFTPPEMLPL